MTKHEELRGLVGKWLSIGSDPNVQIQIRNLHAELADELAVVLDGEAPAQRVSEAGENLWQRCLSLVERCREKTPDKWDFAYELEQICRRYYAALGAEREGDGVYWNGITQQEEYAPPAEPKPICEACGNNTDGLVDGQAGIPMAVAKADRRGDPVCDKSGLSAKSGRGDATVSDKVDELLDELADELEFCHTKEAVLKVLHRELGPKLRAGWVMRKYVSDPYDMCTTPDCPTCGKAKAWDAAWAANGDSSQVQAKQDPGCEKGSREESGSDQPRA